ncbi:DUF6879 family protein [Streptomyces sp. NPDC006173]|uniref:DUF6879 family protein n=1 Tax=Streptomyces sp. NPDC006173 TaxID=3155349 RepID=UPI0033EEC928
MPDLIPFQEITHLFTEFKHTAWRLETQRGYATDRDSPNWPSFQKDQAILLALPPLDIPVHDIVSLGGVTVGISLFACDFTRW